MQFAGSFASPEARFIGRQTELAALVRQYELACARQTRIALVAGEPGIGKTRLLAAIGARAAEAGALVLHGGASEAEGMPPYLPFLEALGPYIRTAPDSTLRRRVGSLAPVLATIFPELASRMGSLEPSYVLPPEQARLRLFEAISTFLAALADDQPCVVLLDDLQWADPASLDLLHYVLQHRSRARLLVVGAYRDGELEQNPALVQAIDRLNRLRLLTTLTVGRLTRDDSALLAAELLGAPVHSAAIERLFAHSEGNPFFLEELLLVWQESGALDREPRADRLGASSRAPANELVLPPGIVSAVRQRLTHLAPDVVDLLTSASIIGRTFDLELLATVAGLDGEHVEERLREAVRARLLRAGDTGTFSFSHDKIRECLYEDLSTVRRRRLHGIIGQALEAHPATLDAYQLAERAFHFARSGDRDRGALYARRAADHAMQAYAPAEAMNYYQTALDLAPADDPQRGYLLLALGEAALLAGSIADALAAFQAARARLHECGDLLQAARAAQQAGHAWWRQEKIEQARQAFEEALALLDTSPSPELVSVLVDLGSVLAGNLHQHAEGIAHSRRALKLAQALGDAQLVVSAMRTLGNLLARGNALGEGTALLEEARALATSLDNPYEVAECYACLAPAYFWQGRLRRSREMTVRRLAYAEQCRDQYQLRHVHTWLAFVGIFLGEWDDVEARLDLAQAAIELLASPEPHAFLHSVRGIAALLRGEHVEAERHLQNATAIFRAIGPGALVWYLGCLALAQASLGAVSEARACMAEVEAVLAQVPPTTMAAADPMVYLTATALVLDDRARLERYRPRLAAFRGQFHDMLIDRLLGEIAVRQADWPTARQCLRAAEASARDEGLAWELARVLEARAAVEARSGRGAGVATRSLLEEAFAIYERLGNQREATRLRERLAGLSSSRGGATLPAGLSRREAEVLRLVAAGRSNRDIADALHLSEKTIENHLTSVYGKTGAENRAAASAFAVRYGLA